MNCVINLPHLSSWQNTGKRPESKKTLSLFCTMQWCVLINTSALFSPWNFRAPHPPHTHTNTQIQNICFTSIFRTRCRQSVIFFAVPQQIYRVLPSLRRPVAVHSPRNPGFCSSAVCSGIYTPQRGNGIGFSLSALILPCRYHSTAFPHRFSHPSPTLCKSNLSND
jgi:hypothetical protein